MSSPPSDDRKWNERSSAARAQDAHINSMFELLFERTADAIWLYNPAAGVFVDCNRAAVELMGAASKAQLLHVRPEDLSTAAQPDGSTAGTTTWLRPTTITQSDT